MVSGIFECTSEKTQTGNKGKISKKFLEWFYFTAKSYIVVEIRKNFQYNFFVIFPAFVMHCERTIALALTRTVHNFSANGYFD